MRIDTVVKNDLNLLYADKSAKGRGRPKRTELDSLRVMVWYQAVAEASGKSAYALEKEFSPSYRQQEFRSSSAWGKYRQGAALPSHPAAGLGLVDRVECAYPGTAHYYRSPIWRALENDPDRPLTHIELRTLFEQLPVDMREVLLQPFPGNRFWRKTTDAVDLEPLLLGRPSMDGVAACVCLAREAEMKQDQQQHLRSINMLQQLLKALDAHAVIGVVSRALRVQVASIWNGTLYWHGSKMLSIGYQFETESWRQTTAS